MGRAFTEYFTRYPVFIAVETVKPAVFQVETCLSAACHFAARPLSPAREAARRGLRRRRWRRGEADRRPAAFLFPPPFSQRDPLPFRERPEAALFRLGLFL